MRENLWQWMVAAVLCGLGSHLLPGGEGGTFGKHWRLLCGICMTLLLLRPVVGVLQGGIDMSAALRSYVQNVAQQAEQQGEAVQDYRELDAHLAAYAIEQALCEQFGMTADEIQVSICLSANGERVSHVYVALSGSAIWKDSHAIERFIVGTLACECTVYIP
ncbi:MAG: hypothetical protein IJY66_00335 [Clostridia bacterium]|nr:hypothetical protein [Clostridia bacterium]